MLGLNSSDFIPQFKLDTGNIANILDSLGKYSEAVTKYQHALSIAKKINNQQAITLSMRNLADTQSKMQQLKDTRT